MPLRGLLLGGKKMISVILWGLLSLFLICNLIMAIGSINITDNHFQKPETLGDLFKFFGDIAVFFICVTFFFIFYSGFIGYFWAADRNDITFSSYGFKKQVVRGDGIPLVFNRGLYFLGLLNLFTKIGNISLNKITKMCKFKLKDIPNPVTWWRGLTDSSQIILTFSSLFIILSVLSSLFIILSVLAFTSDKRSEVAEKAVEAKFYEYNGTPKFKVGDIVRRYGENSVYIDKIIHKVENGVYLVDFAEGMTASYSASWFDEDYYAVGRKVLNSQEAARAVSVQQIVVNNLETDQEQIDRLTIELAGLIEAKKAKDAKAKKLADLTAKLEKLKKEIDEVSQ